MNLHDPTVRQVVRAAVSEMSASMTRVEAERDLMKEITKRMHEDHSISKKAFKKLARAHHKQSFNKETEEYDEFSTLYDTVLGVPQTP